MTARFSFPSLVLSVLVLQGCGRAPEFVDPDVWPDSSCHSDHVPVLGSTLARWESHRLQMPDGVVLAVGLLLPAEAGCWPGILYMPEGFAPGLPEWDDPASAVVAGAGVVLAVFDPRGRGESSGEADYVGTGQQDDAAAVLAWLAGREDVDSARTYVRSRSLGVVLATGAVHRHPTLAPAGLVDIEGPGVLPDDLEHASEQARERWALISEGQGEEFWDERNPSQLLETFSGRYRRIQAIEDHQLGPYMGGAQAMLETASRGVSTTVDLNGLTPDDAVETHSTQDVVWPYPMVQEFALEGRVKHDDVRALDLILDFIQ